MTNQERLIPLTLLSLVEEEEPIQVVLLSWSVSGLKQHLHNNRFNNTSHSQFEWQNHLMRTSEKQHKQFPYYSCWHTVNIRSNKLSPTFYQKLVLPLTALEEQVFGKLSPLRHRSLRGSRPEMHGVRILTITYIKAHRSPTQMETTINRISQMRVQMIRSNEQDAMICQTRIAFHSNLTWIETWIETDVEIWWQQANTFKSTWDDLVYLSLGINAVYKHKFHR